MLKQIEINKKWATYEQICGLHAIEKDGKVKNRLLIIVLAYEGMKSEDIAKIVKLTGVTVRKHMKRYNRRGANGLKDLSRPGGEPSLSEEELREVDQVVQKTPREAGMEVNNWKGRILVEWIYRSFNKKVSLQTAYNILHKLNFSKTRAKRQNKKADPEAAEEFREKLRTVMETKDEDTMILYEDEAIFSSEPTATSVWTKVGVQAIVKTHGETRKNAVVFGAVDPEKGEFFELFSNAGNTENFKAFLSMVSEKTKPRNVLMLLDNAIYHHFKGIAQWLLDEVENISLMYFPSYWSDLNSIEHLWKDTRSNVTHNTFFDTFDLMVDNLKEYMADLKFLPGKLTKLCKAIY